MDKPKWWLIHDGQLRAAFVRIEEGDISAEEAYAALCEHAVIEPIVGIKTEDPSG